MAAMNSGNIACIAGSPTVRSNSEFPGAASNTSAIEIALFKFAMSEVSCCSSCKTWLRYSLVSFSVGGSRMSHTPAPPKRCSTKSYCSTSGLSWRKFFVKSVSRFRLTLPQAARADKTNAPAASNLPCLLDPCSKRSSSRPIACSPVS